MGSNAQMANSPAPMGGTYPQKAANSRGETEMFFSTQGAMPPSAPAAPTVPAPAPMGMPTPQPVNPSALIGGSMMRNPFLNQAFDRAADTVEGRMRNATAMQGLSNSGVQQMYNRNLNDLATGIFGGAYDRDANRRMQSGLAISQMQQQARNNDLNRQFAAAQAMPGFLSGAAQFPLGLGDIYRSQQQERINTQMGRFQEAQQYPYRSLDVLGRAIAGSMGAGGTTSSVTTQPGMYQPNSTAGMLGTGLAGLGLLSALRG